MYNKSYMEYIVNWLQNYQAGANTAYDYALALVVFIGSLVVLKIIQIIILGKLKKLAKKSKTKFDDIVIEILSNVRPPFYLLISLFVAIQYLTLGDLASSLIKAFFLISITFEVVQALDKIVNYLLSVYIKKTADSEQEQKHIESVSKTMRLIVKVALWLVGLIVILANLGINVTSLVASLGIGGIAVALALQNVLGDMFSSFSIYIDKPFKVGDFIAVGEAKGTVERIGLKSTSIRTLGGEEMVIPNKELTDARVQNYKRMERRRYMFSLGVVYGTSQEKLEKIPKIIEEIINDIDDVDFDRAHFASYGDFSLNFDVSYYVNIIDFKEYMDRRQKINLEIYKQFGKEGIEFAYPTQTLFVNKT